MNKKGDITVTIFVIGVVALCFFALISFYISNSGTSDNFKNLGAIQEVNNKIERGDNPDNTKFNRYESKKEQSYIPLWRDEKVLFEVTYPIK